MNKNLKGHILMSKTAFYFKTQEEYHRVFLFVDELNKNAKKRLKIRGLIITAKSRYVGDPRADNNPTSVPYNISTKKKYIGILDGNKHNMERAGIDPVAVLKKFDVERVQHSDSLPRYQGETSSDYAHIKGYEQFKKLVSVFNKRFGHGNWRINGPKKLQEKLKLIDGAKSMWGEGDRLRKIYPTGIKIKIVVNEPDIEVKKYIFKVVLMT